MSRISFRRSRTLRLLPANTRVIPSKARDPLPVDATCSIGRGSFAVFAAQDDTDKQKKGRARSPSPSRRIKNLELDARAHFEAARLLPRGTDAECAREAVRAGLRSE